MTELTDKQIADYVRDIFRGRKSLAVLGKSGGIDSKFDSLEYFGDCVNNRDYKEGKIYLVTYVVSNESGSYNEFTAYMKYFIEHPARIFNVDSVMAKLSVPEKFFIFPNEDRVSMDRVTNVEEV